MMWVQGFLYKANRVPAKLETRILSPRADAS
jgi:hypothetical protein